MRRLGGTAHHPTLSNNPSIDINRNHTCRLEQFQEGRFAMDIEPCSVSL